MWQSSLFPISLAWILNNFSLFCHFISHFRWVGGAYCRPWVSSEVSSSAKMRLTSGSPRPILPAFLAFTVAAFLPQLSSGAAPFPQDLEPISIVGRESKFKIVCVAMVNLVPGLIVKQGEGLYIISREHALVKVDVFKTMFVESTCAEICYRAWIHFNFFSSFWYENRKDTMENLSCILNCPQILSNQRQN